MATADKFKYMSNEYPYLDGVDVYAYENNFNYNLWGVNTKIRVLHVSWDITYENVVKFKDNAARDKWTADNTKAIYNIETAINVQPDGEVKLDIPFDVLSKCNYIVIDYPIAHVAGEQSDRMGHAGYFINNVMQLAPSTTKANVTVDYWYTFINDIDITYLDLERGHAPLSKINATQYLKNPLENNEYLLTPDVNFGNAGDKIKQAAEWIANDGDIFAVIATSGNALSQYWGTNGQRDMQTPGIAAPDFFGGATYDYIAMPEERFSEFVVLCNTHRPHFIPTIAGVFFVPKKLIWLSDAFTWENFNDIPMYFLDTSQFKYNILNLKKSDFNYDSKYAELAKLYTYPYAFLEITDENGNVSEVNIENTTGKIDIDAHLNLIYPFLGLDVILLGIGGTEEVSSTFGYRGARNRKFEHSGNWYKHIKSWNIPAFIVSQSRSDQAQFDRYFSNAQANNALNTAYDNAYDSAYIGYSNTEANNLTSRNISNRNTTNSKTISDRNAAASYDNTFDNTYAATQQNALTDRNLSYVNTRRSNTYTNDSLVNAGQQQNAARALNSTISGLGAYQSVNNNAVAMTAAAGQAVAGAVGGGVAGPAGVAAGLAGATFTGIQSSAVLSNNLNLLNQTVDAQNAYFSDMYGTATGFDPDGGYVYQKGLYQGINSNALVPQATALTTAYNTDIMQNGTNASLAKSTTQYASTLGGTGQFLNPQGTLSNDHTYMGTATRTLNTSNSNNTDNYNTANQNTADTYNTAHNNAIATRDLNERIAGRNQLLAINAIDNGNRQQGVQAPAIYGSISNAGTAATRPIGLFVNIATQSKAAIKAAGDYFLRYGYALNQAWTPDKLQLMKNFTYWKASDVWIAGRGNVIEEASETIKNIFLNGVTVWDDPAKVSAVSIYDN